MHSACIWSLATGSVKDTAMVWLVILELKPTSVDSQDQHSSVYIFFSVFVFVCLSVCFEVHACTCTCTYMYMYLHVHVHVHVCRSLYDHTYLDLSQPEPQIQLQENRPNVSGKPMHTVFVCCNQRLVTGTGHIHAGSLPRQYQPNTTEWANAQSSTCVVLSLGFPACLVPRLPSFFSGYAKRPKKLGSWEAWGRGYSLACSTYM